jgi:RNA polymerase sigma-70 factor (ECF subfamily)
VVDALRDVPHEQKRALLLAALGGRTAQEIGAIEDIPLGTAKTRIRTGMRRVRAALEEQAPVSEWGEL